MILGRTTLSALLGFLSLVCVQAEHHGAALILEARAQDFAIARTARPAVSELDRLDRMVHESQRQLFGWLQDSERLPQRSLTAYLGAERALNKARHETWRSMSFTRRLPVQISEPLALALLDLHVEVRRALGPANHTRVPALSEDAGCAGDIVGDRLITTYARGVTDPLQTTTTIAVSEAMVLDRLARQIACLGVFQLAQLEQAILVGFITVSQRMEKHGVTALIPAFARAVAPLQLLVLDARKHRGERSLAWQWFHLYREPLEDEVGRAGWGANGVVYLWDRKLARLVGFPSCPQGRPAPGCVDPGALIRSLASPQAISLGDCALAGMLGRGVTELSGAALYACPPLPCSADGLLETAEIRRIEERLAARWPSTAPAQLSLERDSPLAALCRPPSDPVSLQGNDPSECTDALFEREANPWDSYAACIAEGSGSGSPDVFARLRGVPMGKGCGRFAEGSQEVPVEEIVFEEDEVPVITADRPGATGPNEPGRGTGISTGGTSTSTTGTSTTGTSSTAGTVTSTDVEAFFEALDELIGTPPRPGTPRPKLTKEDIDSMAWDVIVQMQMGIRSEEDGYERLQELHEMRKGLKSCLSPEDCPDACTGLGAQVARAKMCTEDLLDAFREAAGLPAREPAAGSAGRPLDIVSIWDPQNAPVDESDAGVCLAGDAPARPSLGCSLMLCPQGGLASTVGDQCQCERDAVGFQPVRALCLAVRCAEGQILTDDCTCQATDAEPTPSVPPGDPVHRGGAPTVTDRGSVNEPAVRIGPPAGPLRP